MKTKLVEQLQKVIEGSLREGLRHGLFGDWTGTLEDGTTIGFRPLEDGTIGTVVSVGGDDQEFSFRITVRPVADPNIRATCPACGEQFVLASDPSSPGLPETIEVRSCASAGVYGVTINCPACRASFDVHGR